MPKYKIYWSAIIAGNSEVEAKNEEEACKFVQNGDIDYFSDVVDLDDIEIIDGEELETKDGNWN